MHGFTSVAWRGVAWRGVAWHDRRKSKPSTGLRELSLKECARIEDLSPLTQLTALETLEVTGDGRCISDVAWVRRLRTLSTLTLHSIGCVTLPLGLLNLTELNVKHCNGLTTVALNSVLESLTTLRMKDCTRLMLVDFENLPSLRQLEVGGSPSIIDSFEWQADMTTKLQSVEISSTRGLRRVGSLACFPGVRKVSFEGCRGLVSVELQEGDLPMADVLLFRHCDSLEDITSIRFLVTLRTLSLDGGTVPNLDALASLSGLTSLKVRDTSGIGNIGITNIDALKQLVNLCSLDLGLKNARTMSAHIHDVLVALTKLEELNWDPRTMGLKAATLQHLPRLRQLTASLECATGMGMLTALESLTLDYYYDDPPAKNVHALRALTGPHGELGELTKLRSLDIGPCPCS